MIERDDTDRLQDSPGPGGVLQTERVTCPVCDRPTEALSYCGHCAAPLRFATVTPDAEALEATTAQDAAQGRSLMKILGLRRNINGRLHGITITNQVVIAALALVIAALLTDQPGIAIALATLIPPTLTLIYLARLDLYDVEPWRVLLLTGAIGVFIGAGISVVNVLLIDELWLDDTSLNAGAAGFVGEFASIPDGPPAALLLLSGVLIPLLGLTAQLAAPIWLRRWSRHRNEVMDGIALGAAAGGGYAAGGAIIFVWPLLTGGDPGGRVSDWTAALLALILIQPLVFALTASLLGAALWHYALTQRSRDLALSLSTALIAAVAGSLGGLLIARYGTAVELLWHATVLLALVAIGRSTLHRALHQDRRAIGFDGHRVVCPSCRQITPRAAFCATCGSPLGAAS